MGKLFGTDGVRGVANEELTGEMAYKLGRAGAYYITKNFKGKRKPVMIIGKDTRVSGDMLEAALAAGMTSVGVDVIKLGIIPTPGVSYLTATNDVDGGVMISASHNPIADNGIKFFTSEGYKLSDEMELDIEDLIFEEYDSIPSPTSINIGNIEETDDLLIKYIDYLLTTVDIDFSGLKIVLDCANGAAYKVAPEVLEQLGAEVIVINNRPAGDKINLDCGSTHPEYVQELVRKENADLGIAHDGDADRVIMVDEKGELVDGDKIMAIAAIYMSENNLLNKNTLVTTAYSNLGLTELMKDNGGEVVISANGDRYVLKEMLENGYNLGGEQSGHIIFLDYNKTGDGVLTAIQTIAIIKKTKKSFSKLAEALKKWPQRLANIKVKKKDGWEKNKKIQDAIKKAESKLEDGRVFVRASGTEPLIRVMLEGKDNNLLEKLENELVKLIKEELN
ncbi:phosphoglucosamine mutase [Natronospora cellulosivora (SeqCode)]